MLRDADLEKAAEGAVRASFSNAGQLCVSMERMFVADQVYDRFVERFVARTQAMTLGATLEWGIDMGTLISQDQLDTVTAHVDDAVAKGARVLTGGRARPDLGPFFYEPTILEGVTPDMTCFGNETFGPVISLYRFHDEADAVARANDGRVRPQRLDLQPGRRPGPRASPRQIKCGTVNINEAFGATFGSIDSPMGGMRAVRHGPPPGQRGHPALHRDPVGGTQRLIRFAPMLGMSDQAYAKVMTAQPAAAEEARPGMTAPTELRLRRPGHRLRLRRLGHRAAADREGLPGRRARGGRAVRRRDFPTTSWDLKKFLFAPEAGCYGIQRIDMVKDCMILAGAGVGGGSLVYANTLYEPLDAFYRDPQWAHITDWKAELAPYYDQAKRMLGVVENPLAHPGRRGDGEGRRARWASATPSTRRRSACSSAARARRRARPSPTRTSAAPARSATRASTAASA